MILSLAFFKGGAHGKPTALSYDEFRTKLDRGEIVLNDSKHPLKVVTAEASSDATITGAFRPSVEYSTLPSEIRGFRFGYGRRTAQEEELQSVLG
ncbi:MAG: hypothetical protein ACQKBU_11490, partial [Verrucomicrobiales bacterium]